MDIHIYMNKFMCDLNLYDYMNIYIQVANVCFYVYICTYMSIYIALRKMVLAA